MNPELKKAISNLITYARYDIGENLEDSIKVIERRLNSIQVIEKPLRGHGANRIHWKLCNQKHGFGA